MRIFTAFSLLLCLFLAGCHDSSGPDPKLETARVNKAQSMRSFFDKAQGNYDSLSGGDKAEFVQLCGGDEEKAMKVWNMMKTGSGGSSK